MTTYEREKLKMVVCRGVSCLSAAQRNAGGRKKDESQPRINHSIVHLTFLCLAPSVGQTACLLDGGPRLILIREAALSAYHALTAWQTRDSKVLQSRNSVIRTSQVPLIQ